MKKQILTAALLSLLTAGLTAAELTVAATPVPHGDILRLVAPDLKAQGYDLKVVEFSDFVSPNIALDAKEVTANYYQHKPFLDDAVKSRGLKIASVAPIHILPMAAYSKRVKSLNDLPKGARISIPNDPANGGRALLLLQSAGATATPLDIADNPKRLRFTEVEAAQVPRTLDDVDVAIVNSNYALGVGLNPIKDSIYLENKDSPYAVVVACRLGDEQNPAVQALVKALTSPKVKNYMINTYKGGVVPVF